jgi:hypothetical protein
LPRLRVTARVTLPVMARVTLPVTARVTLPVTARVTLPVMVREMARVTVPAPDRLRQHPPTHPSPQASRPRRQILLQPMLL